MFGMEWLVDDVGEARGVDAGWVMRRRRRGCGRMKGEGEGRWGRVGWGGMDLEALLRDGERVGWRTGGLGEGSGRGAGGVVARGAVSGIDMASGRCMRRRWEAVWDEENGREYHIWGTRHGSEGVGNREARRA
tara:strand:+ start:14217 stop:14615 length:399 start_codon:yes stop_codon:yes gene_type:complete